MVRVESIDDRDPSRESGEPAYPPSEDRAVRAHEDRRLLERYHAGSDPAAREQLVERFLPLARQLARRYQRGGEALDDLVQVASLGLLKAIDRFDPSRERSATLRSTFSASSWRSRGTRTDQVLSRKWRLSSPRIVGTA